MTEVTVSLAPLDSTDMAWARENRNQYDLWRWCRQVGPVSDKAQFEWFEAQHKDPTIRMFKVVADTGEKKAPVGVCGLTSIDWVNRRAEFSCWVDTKLQRRGLGRISLTLLLEFAFDHMGLNVVWGESFAGNPALLLFASLGFKAEGTRRQFYFRDGKFTDAHLFSITREEFYDRRAASGASPDPSRSGGDVLPEANKPRPETEKPAVTRRQGGKRGVRRKGAGAAEAGGA